MSNATSTTEPAAVQARAWDGIQPPVTCCAPADLDQPAQTTLYEITRDCMYMLTELQLYLLATASDYADTDGVARLQVRQTAENIKDLHKNLTAMGRTQDWSPPSSGLEVAAEFAAIAELGLIAIATVGSPEHFLVFVGTPHHQSAVVRAAAEFINSTFEEHAAA
jgi:hypothetical protein